MEHSAQLLNKTISQGIQYLWTQVAQVYDDPSSEKSRDFFNDLPNILFIILGGQNKKGWLTQCYEDAANPSRFSLQNADENIRGLIQLLSPQAVRGIQKANLYTLLFDRKIADGYRFQLSASVLPDHIQELRRNCVWKHPTVCRFANMFESGGQSEIPSSMTSQVVLSPGDWFLFAFAFNLRSSRPVYSMNKRFKSESSSDIYAEELIKNPFLILLRHYLEYFHEQAFSESSNSNKRGGNNFRKFSFIVEEYLIGESLFELNPQQSIQIQLHYSILEGISNDQLRKIQQEQNYLQKSYLSQVSQYQQQSSQQSASKIHSLQNNNDQIDSLSGYSRSNIQSNIEAAYLNPTFANRKPMGKSISQPTPCTFQALLILLHLKRKYFRLLSLSNTNNNTTIFRKGNSGSSGIYQMQSQISSYSSQLGSQIYPQNSQSLYSSQLGNNSILRSSISRYQPQQQQQQQQEQIQSSSVIFKEWEKKTLSSQICNLEYFREEGEDSMLSLTFKKLSLFLSSSLEQLTKESSKSLPSDSLYDHSRLLLSLLGHFNYFTHNSCEQELFEYLTRVDEQSDYLNYVRSSEKYNLMSNPVQPPLRPSMSNFQLKNGDFETLLPPPFRENKKNNSFRQTQVIHQGQQQYPSFQHQQSQISNFKEQIGFFSDELTALRFKMFSSAATFLTNRYLQAVSSQKEISLSEINQLCVLLDVLCNGVNDEDVITRLNSLDIVIIRYSCELFMLREHSDDAFSLFCTNDSLQIFHRLNSLIVQFLKKKEINLSQNTNNQMNSFRGSVIQLPIKNSLSSNITDPAEIVQHFKNILDALHSRAIQNNRNINQHNNFSSSSLNDTNKYQEDYSSQILNKRKPYNFNSWNAPLSSYESSLLFFIMLQLSFFIDYIKTGKKAELNVKYPKTNLRKFANFYFTLAILMLIGFGFFIFTLINSDYSSQGSAKLSNSQNNSNNQFKTAKDFGIQD